MTALDAAPLAAVVAAVGVALMLVSRPARIRLVGVGLLAAGGTVVAVAAAPEVVDEVRSRGALGLLYLAAAAAAVLLGGQVFVRWPLVLPLAALATGWARIRVGSGATDVSLLLPLYYVIAAALVGYAWECLRGRRPPPRLGVLGYALALFVLLACASIWWAIDPARTAIALVGFYLPFAALAAMIGSLEPRRIRPPLLVTLQLALAAAFAAIGIYQWRTGEIFWNPKVFNANALGPFFRVNSVFYDPSVFGRYEALAILTVVSVAVFAAARWRSFAPILLLPLLAAGLFLSYSQSSFIALAAGLLAIAAIVWRRRALYLLLAGVIGGLAVLALPGPRAALTDNANAFTSDRLNLASYGIDAFRARPLVGAGIYNFGQATGRTTGQKRARAPHTAPIGVAAELGLAGLVALLLVALATVRALLRPATPGYEQALRRTTGAALAAVAAHSLFYNALFEDPFSWAAVALAGALAAPSPDPSTETSTAANTASVRASSSAGDEAETIAKPILPDAD